MTRPQRGLIPGAMLIQDLRAEPGLRHQALDLNAGVEAWTSPLDAPALGRLLAAASVADGAVDEEGRLLAFLLGFEEGADYASPNFLWFRDRHPRFAYVDRVVTAEQARGRGLGRLLYDRFGAWALARGHDRLCCEVSLSPPNPGSDAFHAALGFREAGQGEPRPGKAVRYLERALP